MSHILKYSEWEDASGNWHCGDIEDLGKGSNLWWLPARMLGMTPAAYLEWVITNYKPDNVYYSDDSSFVGWNWRSQTAMRRMKNDINAKARAKGFMIC